MRSLVIDDEFVALTKMTGLLGALGECDAATSGEQALMMFIKALENHKPYTLVTIDINMPDVNGITLLGRFNAEEKVRGCPRSRKFVVTAESRVANVRAALASDCDGFLVKPVRRAVLLEKLVAVDLLLPSAIAASASDNKP